MFQTSTYERPSLRTRVMRSAVIVVTNALAWVVIPSLFLQQSLQSYPNISFSYYEVFGFGGAITALQVLSVLSDRTGSAVTFRAAGYVVEVYYIYVALDGGYLTVSSVVTLQISFPVLMLVLMAYPLYGIVTTALSYLLDEHEGSRPMSEVIET